MKLVFPDACWNRSLISGALFLYFHDEKVSLTLHPSVSTFLTGIDPFDFVRLVGMRNPDWSPRFFAFFDHWKVFQANLRATLTLLEPLRGLATKSIWLSYGRGAKAWASAEDLLASSSLALEEIVALIDPFSASDELFAHIFFERYLELYEGHKTPEQLRALGQESAEGIPKPVDVDWGALYAYCSERFQSAEIGTILATAYMFRLPILRASSSVILSNPNLVKFLASLPLEPKRPENTAGRSGIDSDVIAWEFFRQLISPHVDPLDESKVRKVVELIERRAKEIDALKSRCLALAKDLGNESDLELLQARIRQHIRASVETEVQAVLSLDKAAIREF
jgi:hypothetical protein